MNHNRGLGMIASDSAVCNQPLTNGRQVPLESMRCCPNPSRSVYSTVYGSGEPAGSVTFTLLCVTVYVSACYHHYEYYSNSVPVRGVAIGVGEEVGREMGDPIYGVPDGTGWTLQWKQHIFLFGPVVSSSP